MGVGGNDFMGRYIVQRFIYMFITLFVIMTLTFISMKLLPGTPFKNQQQLTPEQLALLNAKYGLDQPIPVQYLHYLSNFVRGDLGLSFQFRGIGVTNVIGTRIGPSAELGLEAMIFGLLVGLLLGIIAALKHNTVLDYGTMVVAVLGISIPSFIFAGALQYIFGVKLEWLPVAYWEGWQNHIMPAFSLSVSVVATIARFMRTEMLEVLGQDYITTAKAKGLSSLAVIVKHSIRNAMIPIITIVGPMTVAIMTGVLVIEHIFAVPGLGDQFVQSILTKDYPVIMGITIFFATLFIVIVLIVDILYGIIDPRIRLAGGDRQ